LRKAPTFGGKELKVSWWRRGSKEKPLLPGKRDEESDEEQVSRETPICPLGVVGDSVS
jgi:hypothetical protein